MGAGGAAKDATGAGSLYARGWFESPPEQRPISHPIPNKMMTAHAVPPCPFAMRSAPPRIPRQIVQEVLPVVCQKSATTTSDFSYLQSSICGRMFEAFEHAAT